MQWLVTYTEQWELLDFRPLLAPNKTENESIISNTFYRKERKKFQRNEKFSELALLASSLIIQFFRAFQILPSMDSYHINIKASEMLVAPRISECFGLGLL